ncbi:Mitochondrial ribosome small subunit biogenesis protein [Conoideocrella luteorostrata]|uniref:Mitochondrial ribosome small subunit biogenesis protein n=1 Tax=Conoideocrella luteorostrata TaxID=1105319 RepID=A0AAJ0FW69_9HYPO|nr:Mitochondrial ribosome small subunit biogenesis protein [Conoideocrella luteorostrata]
MHRVATARWLNRVLRIGDIAPATGVPVFLCPAIGLSWTGTGRQAIRSSTPRPRFNHTDALPINTVLEEAENPPEVLEKPVRKLPVTCSGCGAFAQTTDSQQLGYFDLQSKRVRLWLHPGKNSLRRTDAAEDKIVDDALKALEGGQLKQLGLSANALIGNEDGRAMAELVTDKPPVCDRCHDLIHHSTASSTAKLTMHHPTVESLRETIEESPFKYNHIYHVIDAADFPMSLIPRLNVLLGDIPLRSKNRRSRSSKFQNDRKTEMSFIVTRGDLLGPTKEIVDSTMPYLREVLRDALGRLGGRVRLGNLRCVSAKRSWWTKEVKEDIWARGGAGWMVGKVNVGKSQLFEAVFPKGRMGEGKRGDRGAVSVYPRGTVAESREHGWQDLDVGELLPPAQPATNYPEMPVVSSLPGTTASPIRVPFGNGKGELIDLPGLVRSDLDLFVKEEHRQSLIMKKRIVPEQVAVKSGKSIILGGGLIRITPKTPDMVFLMYNFTPIEEHLTMTEKATAFQDQTRQSIGVESIALPGVGDKMKHAGTFKLCHDVTKTRAGPLTRKNAVGLQVDRLPFRVVSVDILIEGVGYVEVVAQVRARDFERWSKMQQDMDRDMDGDREETSSEDHDGWVPPRDEDEPMPSSDPFEEIMRSRRDTLGAVAAPAKQAAKSPEPDWPAVDVFSPEGKFVGSRKPIQGWLSNKPRVLAEHKKSRPRRSMKGVKKKGKVERRTRDGDE